MQFIPQAISAYIQLMKNITENEDIIPKIAKILGTERYRDLNTTNPKINRKRRNHYSLKEHISTSIVTITQVKSDQWWKVYKGLKLTTPTCSENKSFKIKISKNTGWIKE